MRRLDGAGSKCPNFEYKDFKMRTESVALGEGAGIKFVLGRIADE